MKRINEVELLKVLKLTYAVVEKDGYVSGAQETEIAEDWADIDSPNYHQDESLKVRTSTIVKKVITENTNDFKIKIPASARDLGYAGYHEQIGPAKSYRRDRANNIGFYTMRKTVKDGVSYDDYADELNKANTPEMEKEFQNIIEWVKTETTSQIEQLQSEYQEKSRKFYQQLNDIATTQIVSMSKESSALGMACYLYSWYLDRETYYAKQAEKDAKAQAKASKQAKIENSTWVPTIETKGKSERAEFTVEVLDVRTFFSFYDESLVYFVTMITEEGNVLVVKTSTNNDALYALIRGYIIDEDGYVYPDVDNRKNRSNPELPVIVKIKGTIKERTEYKGNKQTVINRIALVEEVQ